MNPRPGQYGLGGTLAAWTQLEPPTQRQATLLRRVYRGREVRTFSRYGVKQWSAALPWTTTVVKDPFALLSVPTIVRETGAVPVIVYRHAGAVLTSYRRMGWTADTEEMRDLQGLPHGGPDDGDDAAAMVEFWVYMHQQVLSWVDDVPDCLLVSHGDITLAGQRGMAALRDAVGLRPPRSTRMQRKAKVHQPSGALHRFDRAPEELAADWRTRLTSSDIDLIERGTASVFDALQRRRLQLPT